MKLVKGLISCTDLLALIQHKVIDLYPNPALCKHGFVDVKNFLQELTVLDIAKMLLEDTNA